MLEIVYTTQFKKDYKLAQKRYIDVEELFKIINMLQNQEIFAGRKERSSFNRKLQRLQGVSCTS